jgi:quinone-modifying oxidoreductase subunit QmoA
MQSDEKTQFIKGQVAKITEDSASGDLEVKAEDSLSGDFLIQKVNLVVLASGMVPAAPKVQVEIDGGLQKDEHGFLTADQPSRGLLAAGCVKRPVDVAACVRDATGAALKALQCCVQ